MATNDDWLTGTTEVTLDPELPICDAHHHLWDFRVDSVEKTYLIIFFTFKTIGMFLIFPITN